MEVYSMGKTATLNIRVNPDVKENAESVLAQLGIPMATAIDMYLKQISLVGGILFSIVLPKAANSVNADMMSVTQIHQKLEKGYADIEKGNVEDAASAFDGKLYCGSIVNMGVKNPDGSICYIIGIRKEIRNKIGKQPGDQVTVTVKEV